MTEFKIDDTHTRTRTRTNLNSFARTKVVCFHFENHCIWFAIHLNGFDHISSPLGGIAKSTRLRQALRSSTMRNKMDEWKCYANKRYCTFLGSTEQVMWIFFFAPFFFEFSFRFEYIKVEHWVKCDQLSWRENVGEKSTFSVWPCNATMSHRILVYSVYTPWQHIELVQNLIYYFPIVFTSKESNYFNAPSSIQAESHNLLGASNIEHYIHFLHFCARHRFNADLGWHRALARMAVLLIFFLCSSSSIIMLDMRWRIQCTISH